MPGIMAWFDWLSCKLFGYTTEEGSRQLVYGAVGNWGEDDKMRGQYVSLGDISEVSDYVLSDQGKMLQERLWVGFLLCFSRRSDN